MTPALLAAVLSRPPWPMLGLASLSGWLALASSHHARLLPQICSVPAGSGFDLRTVEDALSINTAAGLVLSWLAMLLAMMPLLLSQPVMHLWRRSLARRRGWAIAAFLAVYSLVWMLAGPVLLALAVMLRMVGQGSEALAITLAGLIALAWRTCPAQQICLNRCHVLPRLSPFSFAADRDCLGFGFRTGMWCVGACWPLMLLPLAADTLHLPLMAVVTLLALKDRVAPTRAPGWLKLS